MDWKFPRCFVVRSSATRLPWRRLVVGVMFLSLLLSGCERFSTTAIGSILKNPRAFQGRTVTVAGEVTGSLNLIVISGYRVRDGSGEITVVTDGAVPKTGDSVRVSGQVDQAVAIGNQGLVVLHEMVDR